MSNKINFIKYNNSDKSFIIAEIGNNHQGDLDKAFMMIDEAAKAGVDAVKFQKRHNKSLYSYEMYNAIYDNENSFGKTYGQHREFLELDIKYYNRLIKRAKKNNLKFIVTPFDFLSLEQLEKLDVDAYKVASADLVNTPLIEKIVKTKKPIIFSTGHSEF